MIFPPRSRLSNYSTLEKERLRRGIFIARAGCFVLVQ